MRGGARAKVLAAARQALLTTQGSAWETAARDGAAGAWLQPPAGGSGGGGGPAAAAAAAAAMPLGGARRVSASLRPQHNAQPAASEQQQHQQQQAYERTCWQCGTRLTAHDLFFCPACESVQPASADTQYFQVFDMDAPRFDLEIPRLEQTYKGLQRRLHPDKYSTASPIEQEYAHQQAAVINQAYDILKRPLRRAHYILNLKGFGACEGMTITDPELLMYVMEAREEVEGEEDPKRLRGLLDQNTELEGRLLQELSAAFKAGDLQQAAQLTTQLRYICRIREAIVDKL